ncbi:MAG: hypothetical protein J6A83_00080 [Clostridia bacterium]|nr:hypothetical protein [Clostridia bacterium]
MKARIKAIFSRENLPQLLRIVGAVTVIYMLYSVVASIVTVNIFTQNDSRLGYDADVLSATLRSVISLAYSLFALSCFMNAYLFFERGELERFLSDEKNQGRFYKRYLFVLRSDFFWISFAILGFWSLVLPIRDIILELEVAIFNDAYFSLNYLLVLLNPLLIFLTIIVTYASALGWVEIKCAKGGLPERKKLGGLIWQLTYTSVGFIVTAAFLPVVLVVIISVFYILGVFSVALPVAAVILLLGYLALKYGRGIISRRRFMKGLKRVCRENKYRLTNVKKIYSSLFFGQEGSNFTVEADGTAYTCKILGIPHRKTPIFLDEEGNATYTHRVLFVAEHISTLNYFFEADKKLNQESVKIIVVAPSDQKVYADDGRSRRKIELGDKVMDYRVYHASSFVNALERQCILK